MKSVFIDETSDHKYKDYFGLCCAVTDSYFYRTLKEETQKILRESGWDLEIEFKGYTLFSASKGDTNISVDKRVEIASKLLNLNVSSKHARISFYYFDKNSSDFKSDYLKFVPIFKTGTKTNSRQLNGLA